MNTLVNPTTVDCFMGNHIPQIKSIIQAMPNKVFDSHEFIDKFSQDFRFGYIHISVDTNIK